MAPNRGLGYLVMFAAENLDTDSLLATLVALTILGITLYQVLELVEAPLSGWKVAERKAFAWLWEIATSKEGMMSLKGKVALVTGAGRNIGRACALEMARRGADVVVNTRKSQDLIEEVAERARSLGVRSLAMLADVTHTDEVEAMVGKAVQELGKIDILVNNANIPRYDRPFVELTREEWDAYIDVILNGAFNCIKAVIGGMIERRWGRIISLSGLSAQRGHPNMAPTCAGKMGIIGLTKGLASEFGPFGITVNAVSPGPIDVIRDPGMNIERRRASALESALGRFGHPEELGATVAFLASEGAGYITGQTIAVNGGLYM